MDRVVFTKSIDLSLVDGVLQEKFPEITAIYNLIDPNKYKVKAHLLDEKQISFTVYCDKEDAVKISNMVQYYTMQLYEQSITISYNIHKDGIDLHMNK